MVENFRVTPSLSGLAQIAAVLGLTTVELVEGLDEKPQLVIVRKNERQIVERDKSRKNTPIDESLAHKRPNRAMDPFMLLQFHPRLHASSLWHTRARRSWSAAGRTAELYSLSARTRAPIGCIKIRFGGVSGTLVGIVVAHGC